MMIDQETSCQVIGWREWVALPELGIRMVKAKVDTGARSSALHAYDIRPINKDGDQWVRFCVHPIQRNNHDSIECEARVLEYRAIRSSNGKVEKRPVIETPVKILDVTWNVELTLTNRDEMGFRMLFGRQAIRGRFFVDAKNSFYGGKPGKKKNKNKTIENPLGANAK